MKTPPSSRFLLAAMLFLGLAPRAWSETATPSVTEGPYYTLSSANLVYSNPTAYGSAHLHTTDGTDNDMLLVYTSSTSSASGTITKLSGYLINTSGTPISGATVELWVADNNGIYWYVSSSSGTNNFANRDRNFQGFGTCTTNSTGYYEFLTIRPGLYTGRIRHYHLKVKVGSTLILTTQFMPADEATSSSNDGIVAGLGSQISLCTYTPTSGSFTFNGATYTGLIVSKNLVINYAATTTAPAITTQPSSVSAAVGGSASFTAAASGTTPMTWQWYKTGSGAISGATSATHTLSNLVAANAGSFYAVATNSAGSATTGTATLTVTAASTPSITTGVTLPGGVIGVAYAQTLVASGGTAPYAWTLASGALPAGLQLSPAGVLSGTPAAAAVSTFTAQVSDAAGVTASRAFTLAVTATGTATKMINVSSRARVETGDNVVIAGFVVSGTGTKHVLVRGIGPGLAAAGISDPLANPTLTVYDTTGTALNTNDDWRAQEAVITATGLAPSNDRDAAISLTLAPGAYTAILSGVSAGTGTAIIEVYDLTTSDSAIRVVNLSTRARVLTGQNVLIGGIVVQGTAGKRFLVRALGPSLAAAGVANTLGDPTVQLVNAAGAVVAANDNWATATNAAEVTATGLAPGSAAESALLVTLTEGSYTVIVSGAGGATGVALIEFYELP